MTNKQHTTLNMSLLPLAIIIALIVGVGYFLLQGEIKLPKFNQGPQIKRLAGFPTTVTITQDMVKQRNVIKSEQDLDSFLNSIDSSGMSALKDKINFDKEFVLGVSTASNEETGHSIRIRKVYEDKKNGTLLVSVEETKMGNNCVLEKGKNVAVDVAVISKTDLKIEFEKIIKNQDCRQESTSSTDTNN